MQNTRNLTNVKPACAPQSGFGLDIGSISYEFVIKPINGGFHSGIPISILPESWFLKAGIFIL